MSNKRLLEDVYGENKAARPWTEQPFDEEDYAYEIETQSVAERVFQMLFGGSNLFLQDDETVTYDKLELWELYLKAPTKQMRESLARQLGPMDEITATVTISKDLGRQNVVLHYSSEPRTFPFPSSIASLPSSVTSTKRRATKELALFFAQRVAKVSLLEEAMRKTDHQPGVLKIERYTEGRLAWEFFVKIDLDGRLLDDGMLHMFQ